MPDSIPLPTPQALPEEASAKEWANLEDDKLSEVLGLPATGDKEPAVEVPRKAVPVEVPEEEAEPPLAAEKKEGAEERPPLTKFTVFDKDGELEVPADITFNFKANGREYEGVPLDKVVKFAQMGVYNAAREEEVQAAKQFVPQLQQTIQDLQNQYQELELRAQRLLVDPDFATRASEHYASLNTPEARAQRAEQMVQYQQDQYAAQYEVQQAQHYIGTEVVPLLEAVVKSNPLVTERELFGEYTTLIAPLLDRGRVPLERLPLVKQLVENQLRPTLESLQAERELDKRKAGATAAQDKVEVVKAKRVAARALAPQGAPGPEAKKATKFNTVDDWLKSGFGGIVPVATDDD